jgi:hypothetical protein
MPSHNQIKKGRERKRGGGRKRKESEGERERGKKKGEKKDICKQRVVTGVQLFWLLPS